MSEDWIEVRPGTIIRRSLVMSAYECSDGTWMLECPEPMGSYSKIEKQVVENLIQNRYVDAEFEKKDFEARIEKARQAIAKEPTK